MHAVFELLERFPHPLLIVGGHALTAHGVERQTMDVDCLIAAADGPALEAHLLGGGFSRVGETEMAAQYAHSSEWIPNVDVLFVDAPAFDKLLADAVPFRTDFARLQAPALAHLIALKLHAIRNQPAREAADLSDIARLLQANPGAIKKEELAALCAQFGPPDAEAKLQTLLTAP